MPSSWGVTLSGLAGAKSGLQAVADNATEMTTYAVVSDVEYAIYVEFGTSKMPANAALRNAIEESMANLESVASGADSPSDISRLLAEDIANGWRENVWVDTGTLRRSITVEEA